MRSKKFEGIMSAAAVMMAAANVFGSRAPRVELDRDARMTVRGELVGVETVRFQGEKRLVAKIFAERGEMVLVDLGTLEELRARMRRDGRQVIATGTPGRVDGRALLIADQIATADGSVIFNRRAAELEHGAQPTAWFAADDEEAIILAPPARRVRIEERARPARQYVEPAPAPRFRSIHGEIIEVRLIGPGDPQVIGIVQTDGGERVPVDFGRESDLARSGQTWRPGQQVHVRVAVDGADSAQPIRQPMHHD